MRNVSTGVLLAALICLSGCKNEVETALDKLYGHRTDVVDALKSVKDESSAKAANTKLKTISKDMVATIRDMDGKKAPKTQLEAARKKMEPKFKEIDKQTEAEIERIQKLNPKLGMFMAEGLIEVGTAPLAALNKLQK